LRRWEELRPELDDYDVQLVTLCTDTSEQIRKGMAKHGAKAVMLSDVDLHVTRQFDLENKNTNIRPPGLAGLPIPTTILADATGIVRWIDQSDDYMVRSEPDRVLAALEQALH
jgi:peroxiredoxin